jgi:hypothetical protein
LAAGKDIQGKANQKNYSMIETISPEKNYDESSSRNAALVKRIHLNSLECSRAQFENDTCCRFKIVIIASCMYKYSALKC